MFEFLIIEPFDMLILKKYIAKILFIHFEAFKSHMFKNNQL